MTGCARRWAVLQAARELDQHELIPEFNPPAVAKKIRRWCETHEISHRVVSENTVWVPRWMSRLIYLRNVGDKTIERALRLGPDALAALMTLEDPRPTLKDLTKGQKR